MRRGNSTEDFEAAKGARHGNTFGKGVDIRISQSWLLEDIEFKHM
jgi:hypothetical protein